ncbi:MAG: MIP/aquaporin family protein, partial [Acidimicrobiia bacterium]
SRGNPLRKYIAEFVATFFLVFVGAGSIISEVFLANFRVTDSFGLLGVALAHGLALAVAIAAVAHISGGHVNPAVTIAFLLSRRISARDAVGYIVSQCAGAIAAAFILKGFSPSEVYNFTGGGVPALAQGISPLAAVGIEGVLTFFLAFAIWGVAVDKRGPNVIAPLAIGLTVTFDTLAGGAFTGAAMNPARWLGPAVASGAFGNFFVWIVGPILGALLGSVLYDTFLLDDQDDLGMMEPEEEDVLVKTGDRSRAEAERSQMRDREERISERQEEVEREMPSRPSPPPPSDEPPPMPPPESPPNAPPTPPT